LGRVGREVVGLVGGVGGWVGGVGRWWVWFGGGFGVGLGGGGSGWGEVSGLAREAVSRWGEGAVGVVKGRRELGGWEAGERTTLPQPPANPKLPTPPSQNRQDPNRQPQVPPPLSRSPLYRLVQQQDVGGRQQQPRQGNAAALPARQVGHQRVAGGAPAFWAWIEAFREGWVGQ
jgi:hypothetical protein